HHHGGGPDLRRGRPDHCPPAGGRGLPAPRDRSTVPARWRHHARGGVDRPARGGSPRPIDHFRVTSGVRMSVPLPILPVLPETSAGFATATVADLQPFYE